MNSTPTRVGQMQVAGGMGTVAQYGCHEFALFALTSLLWALHTFCARALAQAPLETRRELASMIDAMANRNPEPEVIGKGARAKPLFADDYDWDEDKRARRAFGAIRDDHEELWEELLNHFDDKRYAWTAEVNGASVEKKTVGGLCRLLASHRLRSPFEEFLPVNEIGRPVRPDLGFGGDLVRWREDRADMSLYELQIQVCESAIKSLKIEGRKQGVPDREIRESCAKIQERINQIRREKRPFFRRLMLDSYYHYKPGDADRIRKELKTKHATEGKSRR
ncbi:MAG TPA: hypothetical protein VF278_12945 [Pirellulales bacterium]